MMHDGCLSSEMFTAAGGEGIKELFMALTSSGALGWAAMWSSPCAGRHRKR